MHMETKRVGLALFGFGRVGRLHFGNILHIPGVDLRYIVDICADDIQKACSIWNLKNTQIINPNDAKTVFQDENVQAVLICVPTDTHVSLIEAAVSAGKHVFCEKPIAAKSAETRKCYKFAKSKNVHLFCAMQRRFDPALNKIFNQVKSGKIGKPQLIVSHNRDHPEPPAAVQSSLGSFFLDVAIHNIDVITTAVQEWPCQVSAMGHAHKQTYKDRGDVDAIGVMLKFPSGLIAYINACRSTPYGYDQRFEVIGTLGAIVDENQRDDNLVFRNENGDHVTPIQYSWPQRYKDAYAAELRHFINLVNGSEAPIVLEEEVVRDLIVIEAMENAFKTNSVVEITY